jgi:hypothetical protein
MHAHDLGYNLKLWMPRKKEGEEIESGMHRCMTDEEKRERLKKT